MTIDDARRIRIVRAYLGMDSRAFAARMGVCPATLTNWERGRSSPGSIKRGELGVLCQEHGLAFSPSGYPFPVADCVVFKQEEAK